jgi:hypothetical protein
VTLATAERTWQALAWDANARVAEVALDLQRAQDCIAKTVVTMEGFEVPLAAGRVHATAVALVALYTPGAERRGGPSPRPEPYRAVPTGQFAARRRAPPQHLSGGASGGARPRGCLAVRHVTTAGHCQLRRKEDDYQERMQLSCPIFAMRDAPVQSFLFRGYSSSHNNQAMSCVECWTRVGVVDLNEDFRKNLLSRVGISG